MKFVIVTGMSGAGKSSVLKMLEDIGYFCIDNLPVQLMPKLADFLRVPNAEINKIALGLDVRSGTKFTEVEALLQDWKEAGFKYEVLYLDATDATLIKRYKETRRNHPLSGTERIEKGLEKERKKLKKIKKEATYIINTSQLLTRELKTEINHIFVENQEHKKIYVSVLSFGFKNGIPTDADLIFDVRFLPNPYYVEELRNLSGNEEAVNDYVMENEKAQVFLEKLVDMVEFLIPNYIEEGKSHLVIGIGCTGGKHRSVTLANQLYLRIKEQDHFGVRLEHRDIERENRIKEV